MNNQDKTRQKLLDSMRKTRTGAAVEVSTEKPVSKKKSKARAKSKSKKIGSSGSQSQSRQQPAAAAQDLYQSGGRIWPD